MKLLILGSHSILEYDDLRLFTDLGYDVFQPGGYADPRNPGESLRPALPDAPYHPDLIALCDEQRQKHAGQPAEYPIIDWAKADLHPDLIDWADVIMVNCFPESWLAGQWARIKHKRVIWRTIGQSNPWTETLMSRFRPDGLEIVRMSPRERSIPGFAGEDAVIRFAKYPEDWSDWTGESTVVGNVTQDMATRGNACGLDFWLAATEGLPVQPAGPRSDLLRGGVGALSYDEMREYLRRCRAYLYVGTVPAPYTLGFIEALMTGVPIISIGAKAWAGPTELFEADAIATWATDTPAQAAIDLERLLADDDDAYQLSQLGRANANVLFSASYIGPQWATYLGSASAEAAA